MASRRGYVTTSEVNDFAGISNATDLEISEAEELIDAYVGYQCPFIEHPIVGKAQSGNTTSFILETTHQNSFQAGYLVGCFAEIIGGTGIGERKKITAQTADGHITTDAFTATLDSTSIYKIYQLGKFPRAEDVEFYSVDGSNTYYKSIPEMLKRAVAAQVEFVRAMGEDFFKTDQAEKVAEKIGDYSYQNAQGVSSINKLIAPKAKHFLRGLTRRTGAIIG